MGNGSARNEKCDCGCGLKNKKCPYKKQLNDFSFTQGINSLILSDSDSVISLFNSSIKKLLSRPIGKDIFIGSNQVEYITQIIMKEASPKLFNNSSFSASNDFWHSKSNHEANKNRYKDQVSRYIALILNMSNELKSEFDTFFNGISIDTITKITSHIPMTMLDRNKIKETAFFKVKDLLSLIPSNERPSESVTLGVLSKLSCDVDEPNFKSKISPYLLVKVCIQDEEWFIGHPHFIHQNLLETFEKIIPNFKKLHDEIKGSACEEYIRGPLIDYFGQSLISNFKYDLQNKLNFESDFIGVENQQALIFEVKGVNLGMLSSGNSSSDYSKIKDGYAQAIRCGQFLSENPLENHKITRSWFICVGLYSVYDEENRVLNIDDFKKSPKLDGINVSIPLEDGDFSYLSIFDLEVLLKAAKALNEPNIFSHFLKQRSKIKIEFTQLLSSEILCLFGSYIKDPTVKFFEKLNSPHMIALSTEFYEEIDNWWLYGSNLYLNNRDFIKKDSM